MANTNLANAKTAKNDEFYTQYSDIQKEMNAYLEYNPDVFRGKTILLPCDDPEWSNFTKFFAQNFESFGIKKLISTSYAVESKKIKEWQPTLFETENPYYDADKSRTNGKIFILDEDINNDGRFNINDLHWSYLEGDGDFRSEEVKALRDEADIIITNPPFSLFREFFTWIMEGKKQFVIVGNINAVSYKEIFPYIKEGKVWLGSSYFNGGAEDSIKKTVYARQTNEAQAQGISNCPECAKGHDNVRTKIYKFAEMDADHVTAWSKGGATTIENCQMLCKTHNRAKGNK